MRRSIRNFLGMLAPRAFLDLVVKFVLFCLLIAFWHVVVRRYAFDDYGTPLYELLQEAICAGAPFVLLFLTGSWHQVLAISALTNRAYFDQLSGLLNRQTFLNRFQRALLKTDCGLLLLIDADHFKRVNDQYGHAVGDCCIEAIGHRLNWHLRDEDLAGRIGGEEFAVFLPNASEEHARAVATRLGQPVSFSDRDGQTHLTVQLSIGATFTDNTKSLEQNFRNADDALYVAKNAGRAQLRFHDSSEVVHLKSLVQNGNTSETQSALSTV